MMHHHCILQTGLCALIGWLCSGALCLAGPSVSEVWTADNGDGTYRNPILHADYSDPDVIRCGDDYYMTASSFNCIPGLPILHSVDLVNWQLIGHALKRYPNEDFSSPQHGKGVWAPSIRCHDGMFYIYWGDPDAGIYMVRAKQPQGPWEPPVLVVAGKGLIDPCPLWDQDGKAYLVHAWAASRCGVKSLLTVRTMNTEGTCAATQGRHVFDGHDDHPTIEGPKFYQRDGYYYILAPAGGVKSGWQTALRSRDIDGPYEAKVVLEQGSTDINGPHQGGLVETPSGQSWFLHFQDRQAYGRIVHLQPVQWQDGWPVMGRYNEANHLYEPVQRNAKPQTKQTGSLATPADSDEFNDDRIGLQWQWQANPQLTWSAMLKGTGYLRLFAQEMPQPTSTLWDMGNLLCQKFPGPDFTATTKMTFTPECMGSWAGLVIIGKDYASLSMTQLENGLLLRQSLCQNADKGQPEIGIEDVLLQTTSVYLRVTVRGPNSRCQFSYSTDNKTFQTLGKPFTARPGQWIGAKVGLFCVRDADSRTGGYADFDWFRITP